MQRTRIWRQRRLDDSRLYCCTDGRGSLAAFTEFVDEIFAGGVDIVQLRDKAMEAKESLAYLEVLRAAALRHGALSAANDRADLAMLTDVDIVHMGQDDLPVALTRRLVGPDMLIGRSTHAIAEAAEAQRDAEVDYFAVGPCWPTPTKAGRPAPGLSLVEEVVALQPTKPWFAIGGIDAERLPSVTALGATRIVVVRALTEAVDAEAAARSLRGALD